MQLTFVQSTLKDFELLVELRIEAMRESLEAIGRFDRDRSTERFRASFNPDNTKKIMNEGVFVGFVAVTEKEDHIYLDHLYVEPSSQSLGIGSAVMKNLIKMSQEKKLPIRLGALRASNSNRFYKRHGFLVTNEDEFDIYYERIIQSE